MVVGVLRPTPAPSTVSASVLAPAQSPIAANERAPVGTALNPIARRHANGCPTPRRVRGSGTDHSRVSSRMSRDSAECSPASTPTPWSASSRRGC